MRSRSGGVDRSKRRPSEYSCRAPLGTPMHTLQRRSPTVTDHAPPRRGDRHHARRLHGGGSRETRQVPTSWTVAYAIRKGMEGEATTGAELHHPFIVWGHV